MVFRNLENAPILKIMSCMSKFDVKKFLLEYSYFEIDYTHVRDVVIDDTDNTITFRAISDENRVKESDLTIEGLFESKTSDEEEDIITELEPDVGREFVEFDDYTPLGQTTTYVPKNKEYEWMKKLVNNYNVERRLGKRQPTLSDDDYRYVMKRLDDISKDKLLQGEYNSSLIVNSYRSLKGFYKIHNRKSKINEYEKDALLFLACKFNTYRMFSYLVTFLVGERDSDYKLNFFNTLNFLVSRYFDNSYDNLRLFLSSPPCVIRKQQLVNILKFLKRDNQLTYIDLKSYLYIVAYECGGNLSMVRDFYNISDGFLSEREYSKFITELNIGSLWDMDFSHFISPDASTNYMNTNQIEYVSEKLKKSIFPNSKRIKDYTRLMLTTESLYSVSRNRASSLLVKKLKSFFGNKKITITDATANVGSDTIALGLNFNHVNAIEMDDTNYYALKNNVESYRLTTVVRLYLGNALDILPTLKQDVIYIDAPWGGRDYKNLTSLKLYLGDYELSDIVNEYRKKCKMFVLKVPRNYDFMYFKKNVKFSFDYDEVLFRRGKTLKFKFLFVYT